nr:hypothetical protein B0A51_10330 [Rachicladosporium sp. CCFEE 5018]
MDHNHDRDGGMHDNPDVFDDEYAVNGTDGVADGFRPRRDSGDSERQQQREPPIRTVSAHYASTAGATMAHALLNRHSTRKSTAQENPFASPEDEGPRLEFERSESLRTESAASYAPGLTRRSTSSASSVNHASSHSPRFGASGPIHPYGMYQQGTVPRSSSGATSSTVRAPNRQSSLREVPQHPYAMYPQGVSEDEPAEDETLIAPTPVGFPGIATQSYLRVQGPDGEEQDIIGADGHTEQLPPYTKYPEEGPKMPLPPPDLHSRQPVAGTDPGMPLMHQHLAPQMIAPMQGASRVQSMTDQSQLERHSSIDRGVDGHASLPLMEQTVSHTTGSTHKSWKEKTWKERRRVKICGLPLMWLLAAVVVVCFVIAVIGGVVGGYKSGSKAGRQWALGTLESTSLLDASIIASPTAVAPTGSYALTLTTPTNVVAGCLVNQAMAGAWSCGLAGNPALAISVGVSPGPKATNGAALYYGSTDTEICYGSQYQFMATDFAPFLTVQDNDDLAKGPAFYFEQTYDKIVVVPENTFAVPPDANAKAKRQNWQLPPGWGQQRQVVNPGERPWFCVWNNTVIEGFIYVTEPIAANWTATTTSSTASATAMGGLASQISPAPTPGPTTMTISGQVVTTTVSSSASSTNTWRNAHHDSDADDHTFRRLRARQTAAPMPGGLYDTLNMYPYVVKLEERRLPGNAVQPYCQQYQILNNGQYGPVVYPNTQDPVLLMLEESDPPYGKVKRGQADMAGSCHCQWSSGE